MGAALSLPSPGGSSIPSLVSEARAAASSARGESLARQLSSSEEVDVLSVKAGKEDSPSLSPPYEGGAGGGHNLCCV